MEFQVRRAVWMEAESVFFIDQRFLPHQVLVAKSSTYRETIDAIRQMALRGAGTIGVTGGFAMAQAALEASEADFWQEIQQALRQITSARPTAKNLSYAVERVFSAMKRAPDIPLARKAAVEEALGIYEDDVRMTERIAKAAVRLIPTGKAVLTHCNAGWLAYPGWGTALAPIYLAHALGQSVFVYVPETRPRGQGAKLTTWELAQSRIPHALIADTACGYTMSRGKVGLVIVGADRIASNGDTANKIGTYPLAVLANRHRIDFYVAAPSPTFDPLCFSGDQIPIEERAQEEVTEVSGALSRAAAGAGGEEITVRLAPSATQAENPAFDVTPAELITGFITECGIIQPNPKAIAGFLETSRHRLPFLPVAEGGKVTCDPRLPELIRWAKTFDGVGMAPSYGEGSHGNVSLRTKGGCLISATRTFLGKLKESDFVEILDCNLKVVPPRVRYRGDLCPSTDSLIHWQIYRWRPEITSILHAHDPLTLRFAEQLKLPQTDQEIQAGSSDLLSLIQPLVRYPYFLLRGHGFVVTGRTIEEAGRLALSLHSQAGALQG